MKKISTFLVLLFFTFLAVNGQTVNLVKNPYANVNWSGYNQYKANYHTHTTNSDGSQSPSTVINEYYSKGYKILSITDHNVTTWPWPSNPGMLAIKGNEYSSSHHMNAMVNFTNNSSNLENGIPHVQSNGGYVQINHPGRYYSPTNWSWYVDWFKNYSSCVTLEVFNQGDRYSDDRKLWDNINENLFAQTGDLVWGTSNDDKHTTSHLYGNFNFMLMPSLTQAAWDECITNGAFYFCTEPGRSGNANVPRISNIVVDNNNKTITITATGYNSIQWIGPGSTVVATGNVFNYSAYTNNPFVRAVLDGSNGNSYTQPFGFETIASNNNSPSCSVTDPANGMHYNNPQSITISASAYDSDGYVSSVEFFINGISIGTDNSSPYSINYNIPSNGSYSITAKATDNEGATTTSSAVGITVGVVAETISVRINSSINDVEEGENGTVYTNSSDIEMVYDSYNSQNNQTVGLRFTGLNIPQGATITSAHIQFTCDETSTGTTNLTIKGHDADNSSAFTTSSNNVSSRTKTSASVNWNPAAWNSVGEAGANQKTPDLSSVVQEIVNRSGFSNSSAITFIITGTGERTAEAYDGKSSSAALLTIEYTTGSSTVEAPISNFTANTTEINAGQSINFADQSTNNPSSWNWAFQGGTPSTSTVQNPTVTYNTPGTYTVALTATNSAGDDTETKTAYITVNSVDYCSNAITSFPYNESFESGFGEFTQEISDDFDWTRRSGRTPSSSTGASGASVGNYYIYTESSNPNYPTKVATIYSPCLDLSLINAELSFDYHMYGSSMGSIEISISTDGNNWTTVFAKSGDQGNQWNSQTVDLSAYNSNAKLRFKVTTANSYRSDVCIDNIAIKDKGAVAITYCDANSNNTSYEFIDNVSFGSINKSSSASSYSDYSSNATNMTIGQTENLTVSISNPYAGDQILVWVDWNNDGDFTDSGENVYTSTASKDNTRSTNITIPSGAAIGQTRMRIRLHDTQYSPNNDACGTSGYGEVEDYTINIMQSSALKNGAIDKNEKLTDKVQDFDFELYPNPTNMGAVRIETNITSDNAQLYIIDISGRVYSNRKIVSKTTDISVKELNSGIYFVKLTDGKNSLTKRLIISK